MSQRHCVAELAKTAALSRSAFFERFERTVGLPPMECTFSTAFSRHVGGPPGR